jgi:hypothetical protein
VAAGTGEGIWCVFADDRAWRAAGARWGYWELEWLALVLGDRSCETASGRLGGDNVLEDTLGSLFRRGLADRGALMVRLIDGE